MQIKGVERVKSVQWSLRIFGSKKGQILPAPGKEKGGRGEMLLPISNRVIPDFQSFLRSFLTFIFFFLNEFYALTPARLMPELNKLQNNDSSKCASRDPISPAVDLLSKHSSIIQNLRNFPKHIVPKFIKVTWAVRASLVQMYRKWLCTRQVLRIAAKKRIKTSKPVLSSVFYESMLLVP